MSRALVVEVLRGAEVESRHELDVVAVGSDGRVGWSRGEAGRSVLPRSSLKPVQAVPLVRGSPGDGRTEELTEERIAIACGSHGGEPEHVAVVDGWLADLGLGPEHLECGAHAPVHRPSADALVAAGDVPTARHNNCSGKHVGFLSVCRQFGIEPAGYLSPGHPLQTDHLAPVIEEHCGHSVVGTTPGIDGCGIPVWAMPLDRLAAGWAALATTEDGQRILAAMVAAPFFVAGSGRACTRLMVAGRGRVAVKTGAEGVYCGVDLASGAAIALKARDGATRASELAIEWAMAELGAGDAPAARRLENWAGSEVGAIRVAD